MRRPSRRSSPDAPVYRVRLPCRPPCDWDAMLGFLAARATPGVEEVRDGVYRRTMILDGAPHGSHGTISARPSSTRRALVVEARVPDAGMLPGIVERIGRVFDLDADPAVIARHFEADALLGPCVSRYPGLRTPGAWDGFELAVRAILGQQVSVRAATTLAGRLASAYGTAVRETEGLNRLFPAPESLRHADLEALGVMPSRAVTIRTLASRTADGAIGFGDGRDTHEALAALRAIPGIGPWTAEYIAMRAFREPDAFPHGDLVLRRAAGGCSAAELDRLSQGWRPWRAYAVMLLWHAGV